VAETGGISGGADGAGRWKRRERPWTFPVTVSPVMTWAVNFLGAPFFNSQHFLYLSPEPQGQGSLRAGLCMIYLSKG
jgi:hypothetical protein